MIVVTVLFLFLGSVRAALLTALTIPLSLMFAFVCMYFTGITANLLSLGALDFGIIVDGTLVMVEHIVLTLEQRKKQDQPTSALEVVRHAALDVERPIFFSLLIIICAYLPLFTLERVERRLFTPMAFTVCYALLGSMLLTLTLIPVLATYLFSRASPEWKNPALAWLQTRYRRILRWSLRRAGTVVFLSAVIVTGSFFVGSFLGSEFLPPLAMETLEMLRTGRGAADTAVEQEADQAQLRIRINRDAVARYGINVRDVQDVIEMAIGGRTVSTFFDEERRFDITVRYVPPARADPATIGTILVPTRDGGRVPLVQLADIRIVDGASIIARRENRRQISVRTNIRGRDQGSFVAEAQRSFAARIKLPPGYTVAWGGQFENLVRARKRLTIILPLTIAIIFALLFSTFGSATHAGLVRLTVPFSLVGGILALYLRNINLSVSAAVGFISLFGVAVMSGVLVVTEIRRQQAETGTAPEDAVVEGALAQMQPVLLMIVVAMLGMVPAALATGIGSDIQRPLATVVVGGLLSTLFLTLLALPALYHFLLRGRARRTSA